jgi:hypothetical protein
VRSQKRLLDFEVTRNNLGGSRVSKAKAQSAWKVAVQQFLPLLIIVLIAASLAYVRLTI